MSRRSLLTLAILTACNEPGQGPVGGTDSGTGGAPEATGASSGGPADGSSSGDQVGASSGDDPAAGSSSGAPDGGDDCPSLASPTPVRWEIVADPDHLSSAVAMLMLDDGSTVVASSHRILQYDAEGSAIALHFPGERVRGLAPTADPETFVALVDDEDSLRLLEYESGGEVDAVSIPFAGVVAGDMPLAHGTETTVLTLQREPEAAVGTLQFRDGALVLSAEVDVAWTLDLWGAKHDGRTFVASLGPTDMGVSAYDGTQEVWSTSIPTIGEDAWLFTNGVAVDGDLIVNSGSSAMPLRAFDLDDGTERWTSAIDPAAMTTSACGDVFGLVAGDVEDALYRITETGPEQVTLLARATMPHAGDAGIQALAIGHGGSIVVARILEGTSTGETFVNLTAY